MAITDFNKWKDIEVTSATDTPTISRALCFKITSGDDSTTGTGEIVLDWSNISSQADIGVYDENNNLLDYYFESFDTSAETAVIWVYRDWVRDGSTQAKIAYGSGPSDQSVVASTVFDKEANLQAGYLLNETSGNALDVTSNNNDGTVTGATQGESGIVGGAYSFDGTDDSVIANFQLQSNSKHTAIIWFKTSSGGNIYNSYEQGVERIYAAIDESTGEIVVRYGGSAYSDFKLYASSYADDNWHCLVQVVDENNSIHELWLDGALADSGTNITGDSSNPTNDIGFGADNTGGNNLKCNLDNILWYLDAFNSDEIIALYAATKSTPDFFSQQVAVTTDSPTNVTSSSATLNGTLNDLQGNSSLDVYFEYGADTSYGNTTATQTISSVPTSFSADISGLTGLETYHYRAVATNGVNHWYGGDVSINTVDLQDVDETQSDFQEGTLTDVEADAGDYLRLADSDVLSFDGVDDYVEVTNSDNVTVSGSAAVEFWVNANEIGNNGDIGVWGNYRFGGSEEGNLCYLRDGNINLDGRNNTGSYYGVRSSINANTYFHAALVSNGSDWILYIDGVEKDRVNAGSIEWGTPTTLLNIGFEDGTGTYMNGIISDFRIWNTARTQTEIQDNMNKRLNGDESGLVAYHKLDEGTGTTATDSAGSNDGTINGASWVIDLSNPFGSTSGNRLSPQLDLSSLGTVSDSIIEWTETLNNQTITIETRVSLDGGSTWTAWATATNGGTIPDLSSGTDVSNGLLECRQSLSTSDTTVTPELHSLSVALTEQTGAISLTINAVSQGQILDASTIAQLHLLGISDIGQAQNIDSISISQLHQLAVEAVSQTQNVDILTIQQLIQLTINAISQGQILDEPTIAKITQLTINAINQSQSINTLTLDQLIQLTTNNIGQSQILDAPNLTVSSELIVYSIAQGQSITSLSLQQAHGLLSLANVLQGQSLDTLTLEQIHSIIANNINQNQSVDTTNLNQLISLSIDAVLQDQIIEEPSLYVVSLIDVDNIQQSQTVEATSVSQISSLIIDTISQEQIINNIIFSMVKGRVYVTINAKKPHADMQGKKPGVTFYGKRPTTKFQ